MNNGRDCVHGRQVGKCDTCDLIDAEQRILELESQVEQLISAEPEWAKIGAILGEKQAAAFKLQRDQHQTEIKAQAVIDAIDAHKNNLLTFDFNTAIRVTDLIRYANQLRQRAKGE